MQNFIFSAFQKRPYAVLFALFILSFVIRFYLADFYKAIYIYPDELRYYQLAENFAHLRGLIIYNLPTDFQKILYSLFLAPAFLFKNREIQQHAFALINSFLVTLSIFPIYWIAKELLNNQKSILLICIFSLFLPDLAYSASFMSENLFLPFSILLFACYLKIILNKGNKHILFIIAGGGFLLYLNKEIAVLFPLSFLAYSFLQYFLDKNIANFKNNLKSFAIIFGVFIILFFAFKFLFFSGLKNSYSTQTSIATAFDLLGDKTISYFFYSAFYFLLHIIMSAYFFGAVFPLVFFQSLNEKNQKALLFLAILLISTTLVMAYTIFIREIMDSMLQETPRALLRYMLYAPIIFFIIFLSLFENKSQNISKKHIIFYSIFLILILMFYKVVEGLAVDSPALFALRKDIIFTKENFYLFKIALAMLAILVFFFLNKNRKISAMIVFSFALVFYILCNIFTYRDLKENYFVGNKERMEAKAIESFIKENKNKIFLVGNKSWFDRKPTRLTDTMFNYENVLIARAHHIVDSMDLGSEDQNILFSQIAFSKLWDVKESDDIQKFYKTSRVDYFIFPKKMRYQFELENGQIASDDFFVVAQKGTKKLENFNGDIFVVFENQNPEILPVFNFMPY